MLGICLHGHCPLIIHCLVYLPKLPLSNELLKDQWLLGNMGVAIATGNPAHLHSRGGRTSLGVSEGCDDEDTGEAEEEEEEEGHTKDHTQSEVR